MDRVEITKKIEDSSNSQYRIKELMKNGYGDGRQVGISGVYSFLKNLFKDERIGRLSDLEMVEAIENNGQVSVDRYVISDLKVHVKKKAEAREKYEIKKKREQK